jgi:hypothetical protein
MPRTLNEVIAALPESRRRKVEARAADLLAEEQSLQDLRVAMSKTQAAVARKLKIGQDSVSRLEKRTDMLLSTLRGFVGSLGGDLHLVATLPGRPPVRLAGLGLLEHRPKIRARRPASRSAAKKKR